LAEGDGSANRRAGRAHYPRAIGEGEGGRRKPSLPETCGQDQRAARPVVAGRVQAVMKGIADTGFIVAFGNRNDRHHAWAVEVAKRIQDPLLTCEAVLAEAAFHLASSSYVLSLVRDKMLRLAFDCSGNQDQLWELATRYEDRRPDFADLCVVRMSELHPQHSVITVDEGDFRVYRRNRREVIPLICPSKGLN